MDQVVATLFLDLFTHAGRHEVGAEANTAWDGISSYRRGRACPWSSIVGSPLNLFSRCRLRA